MTVAEAVLRHGIRGWRFTFDLDFTIQDYTRAGLALVENFTGGAVLANRD